jgi:hypothetical protein
MIRESAGDLSQLLAADQSADNLLDIVSGTMGQQAFAVVDHWDADPDAVGLANASDPRVLVYVRVYDVAPRYFLSFESAAAGEWAESPYLPAGELSVNTLTEVFELVRSFPFVPGHLSKVSLSVPSWRSRRGGWHCSAVRRSRAVSSRPGQRNHEH